MDRFNGLMFFGIVCICVAPCFEARKRSLVRNLAFYSKSWPYSWTGHFAGNRLDKDEEKFIPRLPSHYAYPLSIDRTSIAKHANRKRPPPLPVFEESSEEDEKFAIFRGRTAELIINTMMSGTPYKMMEPSPGQILQPPFVPVYKAGYRKNASFSKYSSTRDWNPYGAEEETSTASFADEVFKQSVEANLSTKTKKPFVIYNKPFVSSNQVLSGSSQKDTTVPQYNNQIKVPTSFGIRYPSTTPMNDQRKPYISHITYVTPSTFKPTKKPIVYFAKNAGFKSHMLLSYHPRKEAMGLRTTNRLKIAKLQAQKSFI